jgi:hypothetical protein
VFFCRAAKRTLEPVGHAPFNRTMTWHHDSDLGDWRRRAQRGSRDILVAAMLTVLAVGLLTLAWLGNGARRTAEPMAAAHKSIPF